MERPPLVEKERSLKDLNWWKVGGTAQYFAAPTTIEELKAAWRWAWREKLPVSVISGGSNILVQDGVVRGLVLSLHGLKGVERVEFVDKDGSRQEAPPESQTSDKTASQIGDKTAPQTGDKIAPRDVDILIHCLAGTPKSDIAKIFLQNRLAPAVFLTGIPGDMGAGVVMNAGIGETRTPREFCEIVRSIEVLRLNESSGEFSLENVPGSRIKWEYRHSSNWQPGIVVKVVVGWKHAPDLAVPKEVMAQTKKRVTTQPLDQANCGSVFRNPLGHKSAQLIESCGLKGYRVGGASVSQKHANFIVNDQGASAEDVHRVIEHVRQTVLAKTGVELKTEVVYIGQW